MSTRLMSACWPLQGMTPAQRSVLISLADNANDEGLCWPSIRAICLRTCLSERAVRHTMRSLEDCGVVRLEKREGHSRFYTISPTSYAPRQEVPQSPASGAPPRTFMEPSSELKGKGVAEEAIPYQAIVDVFNRTLPELLGVEILNAERRRRLRQRRRESSAYRSLTFWADYFAAVWESDFLMGRVGKRSFHCCFDWLIRTGNFG